MPQCAMLRTKCSEISAITIPLLSFLQVRQVCETEAVLLRCSGVRDASRDAVDCTFVECVKLPRATGLAAAETDAVLLHKSGVRDVLRDLFDCI